MTSPTRSFFTALTLSLFLGASLASAATANPVAPGDVDNDGVTETNLKLPEFDKLCGDNGDDSFTCFFFRGLRSLASAPSVASGDLNGDGVSDEDPCSGMTDVVCFFAFDPTFGIKSISEKQ